MKSGESVALRNPGEILATLDDSGCLEGLPFMPEMLGYFGKVFTVDVRVERACDTISYTGVRRLRSTVMLEDLRCDGSGHAGCGAQCRLYWKEAWLEPVSSRGPKPEAPPRESMDRLRDRVNAGAYAKGSAPDQPLFRCQATELLRASEPVGWWSLRSMFSELTLGNVGPLRFVRVMTRLVIEEIARRLHLLTTHPFRPNELAGKDAAEPEPLGLKPGQLVQIKSPREISRTLNDRGKTRGLWFDREMLPYCGRTARVKAKVERFIDEGSGRLVELNSDCYILDDVVCQSSRSDGRWFCPRAIYPWWRESWLETVDPAVDNPAARAR